MNDMTDRDIITRIDELNAVDGEFTIEHARALIDFCRVAIHHVRDHELARYLLTIVYVDHVERFEPAAMNDELHGERDSVACDYDNLAERILEG